MNIFILDKDIQKSVHYYVDSHVRKIPVEINQMLATALHNHNPAAKIHKKDGEAYKPCFQHHPCTRWVSASKANFLYTVELGIYLCEEYRYRFGRCISTLDATLEALDLCDTIRSDSDTDYPNQFAVAVNNDLLKEMYSKGLFSPKEYVSLTSKKFVPQDLALKTYHEYYNIGKRHLATWSKRNTPEFYRS